MNSKRKESNIVQKVLSFLKELISAIKGILYVLLFLVAIFYQSIPRNKRLISVKPVKKLDLKSSKKKIDRAF